jgi:prevent-host-death family protein
MGYHARFGIYDAKAKFSSLVQRIEAGEEIIICRRGRPVARLIPEPDADGVRRPGRARGMLSVKPYFLRVVHEDAVPEEER